VLRSTAATAALALLGLGLPAAAQTPLFAGPPDSPVEIEADHIVYSWDPPVLKLDGHVVARRDGAILRAGSGVLDRGKGVLKLEGGVLGVQGKQVFLSDAALVDLEARTADLTKAVLFLKERPANPDAPRTGANALTLHGSRIRQLQKGRFLAEDVTLTPCDCAGEPDYVLEAKTAEIEDDRAHLHRVKLRLLGAPLPFFPLSLPLTDRQSGLLAPQPGFGGPVGFAYSQPFFFTLGRSYDVTISPGVFTGGHAHQATVGERSVKGPRLDLETRYAPIEGTTGTLTLDMLQDLDRHDPSSEPGHDRGYGGLRLVARIAHRSEGDAGVLAAQGIAAGDVMALRDVAAAQSIENSFDLFTTDVGFWRARGPLTLGADATFMQDMRIIDPAAPDRRLFGPEGGRTFQRLPATFVQLAPVALGAATVSVEGSAVYFTRFGSPDPREQVKGFGQTDRATDPFLDYADAARAPALRFDLSPRVAIAAPHTFPIDLRLEGGARFDRWIVDGHEGRDRTRAYALAGARAALPLERRYGSTLHRIEPSFEVRALSKPFSSGGPPFGDVTDAGGATFAADAEHAQQGLAAAGQTVLGVPAFRRAYDEIDFAAPATGAVEATASLAQSLWTKPGATPGRILRFDLLQDALLWADGASARMGETSAVLSAQLGPGGVQGTVRYDWKLHEVSVVWASGGIRDQRGDEVHAGLSLLRGSERLRGGIDELFSAARLFATPTALTGSAGAGISGPLPLGFRAGYDVSHVPGETPAEFANWTHSALLTLETSCHCAGLQLSASLPFHDAHLLRAPSFSLRIDLKALGSFSTF
jgi:LPS-assembly protein